jgi:hypothetical protein
MNASPGGADRAPWVRVADLNLAFGLLIVVLIAALIRFLPLGTSNYPINDGGLFAHMVDDLVRNGFGLPASTTYNGEAIPFAYPPLGIYLTAVIAGIWGVDPIFVLRWLPAALSTASVIAMHLMAAELLRSRWRGLVAAAAFAVMPRSYIWLIDGGGITRSLGLLLALLALQQGIRMLRTHKSIHVLSTAVLGGLTLLSHPQAALFLSASLLVLLGFHMFRGRPVAVVVQLAIAGLGGLLVAAPWIVAVVANHGAAPLLSAGRTALDPANGLGLLLGLSFTDNPALDLMTALGVVGVFVRLARGQWMVPAWLMAAVLIDPRAGATYATVPLALSVVPILGELVLRMIPAQGGPGTLESDPMPQLVRTHRAASVVMALLLFATLRTAARTAADPGAPMHGLQDDQAAAMRWVAANTETSARFAIVTGRAWQWDYFSEWFPVLAARTSIATVQGSEWTGIDSFLDRLAMSQQLQRCATDTETCLASWMHVWDASGVYVFIPKGHLSGPASPTDCCPALRETLESSANYHVIYDGAGASIFAPAKR